MKQYEYIENKWARNNSKWDLEWTKAKIVDEENEKYKEEYKKIKKNRIKEVKNNGRVKREIIIIEK